MSSPGPKNPPRGKRRRRRQPSLERRAAGVLRELRALGRSLAEREGLAPGERFPLKRLVLPLTVEFEAGPEGWEEECATALLRDYRSHVGEALKALNTFRPGRVYCFQCDSNDCVHSAPGDVVDTFRGYTATGKPSWQSFLSLCLERGDPRVDRLYDERPEVIAFVQSADELKGDLLPGFGRNSLAFNVLGQVVAGLMPANFDARRGDTARVALTVQILETRSGEAPTRLRMNLLGLAPDDIAAAAANRPRGRADRLRKAIHATRRRIDALGRRVVQAERRGQRLVLEIEVEPLLSRLKGDIERIFRPHQRRTAHAQERHLGGDRPTASALRDAREAGDESFFFDVERKTIIVIGRRGRAHVFSPEGRHVTSIQLKPGELERKSGRARWRPLARLQLESFRSGVKEGRRGEGGRRGGGKGGTGEKKTREGRKRGTGEKKG